MSEQEAAKAAEWNPNEYRVSLPEFEGPLDLLLHLIQKHELDILNIPIGFIAEKYVEFIRRMEGLSIDVASDYLVMAATLVHIKSRMLLPPDPSQIEEDELGMEEEDPRAELIRRLLEYQKYKLAAGELGERSVLGRDVFPRGSAIDATEGLAPLASLSLFRLVDAFEAVLQRAKHTEEHLIDFERISISDKIAQISDRLRLHKVLRFEELFANDESRAEMIVTFLALLEMTKLRMTNLSQAGPLEPITVELSVRDNEDEDPSLAVLSKPTSFEDAAPAELPPLADEPLFPSADVYAAETNLEALEDELRAELLEEGISLDFLMGDPPEELLEEEAPPAEQGLLPEETPLVEEGLLAEQGLLPEEAPLAEETPLVEEGLLAEQGLLEKETLLEEDALEKTPQPAQAETVAEVVMDDSEALTDASHDTDEHHG